MYNITEKIQSLVGEIEKELSTMSPEKITEPTQAVKILTAALPCNTKEHFLTLTLDGSHKPIQTHLISTGTVNRSLVHPREVFRPAILDNAAAIIVAHNHPSGNFSPSTEDHEVTKRLKQAADIIGIPLLDHVILTNTFYQYYSALAKGDL